jgi:hypothetical protein
LPPGRRKKLLTFWEVDIANELLSQVLKCIVSMGGLRNAVCCCVRRVFTLLVINERSHNLLSGRLGRGI